MLSHGGKGGVVLCRCGLYSVYMFVSGMKCSICIHVCHQLYTAYSFTIYLCICVYIYAYSIWTAVR